ncbi:uncharacterized protein CC84DRAFT_1219689 [Paraphaeosphaeria sporulosa]|uniref:Uncharacterized protein n=1 Tax=Paraphaeosphaeria sporulosa TaxID=1460663 RepID=A0A177C537_9PLEO|nr:uncharacterized protein CC84DRAFT_1219689 [Paraphaeosphaeria sporulosa]OAG02733.1 hypothetical protein CC84DRAFT_1219689 [Paraphaeosphaeria sporulosa]
MCRKRKYDAELPAEMVRGLERLENEVNRYQGENKELRERLKAAETEVTTLQDHVASHKNKLNGGDKKVRSAKDVAGKQEEKAKDAVREKQDPSLTKLCDDLRADLEVERAGRSNKRKDDSASDITVAVVPVELTISRGNFLTLSETLEISQATVAMQLQDWYDEWMKPDDPVKQVLGADFVDNEKK